MYILSWKYIEKNFQIICSLSNAMCNIVLQNQFRMRVETNFLVYACKRVRGMYVRVQACLVYFIFYK